jgi:hypothetical protein
MSELMLGEKISVINAVAGIAKKTIEILDSPRVYPQRKTVSFKKYHNRARTQYWVCGTSLEILTKGELIHEIAGKNGLDFRILLPYVSPCPNACPCLSSCPCSNSCPWPSPSSCPCPKTASRVQLEEYDKLRKDGESPSQLYTDQAEEAGKMYDTLKEILKGKGIAIKDRLRLYRGIMFQNITILDDHAFISFYDARGIGNDNITIYCNGKKNKRFMEQIKELFTDMWGMANG